LNDKSAALVRVLGALLSGCLLALAGSLHPIWSAAWVASVPVLVAAFMSNGRTAWWLGLTAGLLSSVSILGYYATVAPLFFVFIVTVLKALLYAGGVRLAWGTRRRLPAAIAVFAFPAWFAAFDVLIATFSADGTAGSPAYSQMNLPIVLQVASLGGTPAVTFVIYLFSSALAHALVGSGTPKRVLGALAPALFIVAATLAFGAWRISTAPTEAGISVALAALDQKSELPDDWTAAVEAYRPLLAEARARHASLTVLPEEIAVASVRDLPAILTDLGGFATDADMSLAAGMRIADEGKLRNVMLFLTPDGRARIYDKQHLVPGLESTRMTPGTRPPLLVEVGGHRFGGAICKDFDFIAVGRSLGIGGASLVVAPAWDFGQDAWLHGRMAMLRAVEGGFTLVRAARNGTMSVSDRFGRVLAEAASGPSSPLLMTQAPVSRTQPTIYSRVGDLFGWACLGLVLLFMASGFRSLHRST
jgi:apolipoprotein N-acyltransferase